MPLGGLLAALEHMRPGHIRDDVLTASIAFGGGVLLVAVALIMVPHGLAHHGPVSIVGLFGGGAVTFLLIDKAIERRGGQAGQVLGAAMDFLPESIGLGSAFAMGGTGGAILLAVLIGLQNLPEGFNAFRELCHSGHSKHAALGTLSLLALIGPVAGVTGFLFLGGQPQLVAALFLFAAGGIVYLVFHDIAPLAYRKGHWAPTLGAVLGFLVGLVGESLLGR